MRLTFQRGAGDVVAAFIASAVLGAFALTATGGPTRLVLGLSFIFFVPGYVLTAALFPSGRGLEWVERLALSVGLSISIVALISLGLNFTPWGISIEPVVVSLLLFTYGVGAIAYGRRMKLPASERLSLSIEIHPPNWSSYSRSDKIATIALAACLIFAAGTILYVVVTPRPAEHFTEFYWLNETGVAGVYQKNLTVNETETIHLTVHNLEYATVGYAINVSLAVMTSFVNVSANATEYRVVSQAPLTNFTFSLDNGGYWNHTFAFSIPSPGIFRLYFDLFKLPDTVDVYRYLFLTLFVKP